MSGHEEFRSRTAQLCRAAGIVLDGAEDAHHDARLPAGEPWGRGEIVRVCAMDGSGPAGAWGGAEISRVTPGASGI